MLRHLTVDSTEMATGNLHFTQNSSCASAERGEISLNALTESILPSTRRCLDASDFYLSKLFMLTMTTVLRVCPQNQKELANMTIAQNAKLGKANKSS